MKHQTYYNSGYKKSISDSHNWRTVANSVNYVVPYLQKQYSILDVGSGPGSITMDFANYVDGKILGVEPTQDLIDAATENLKLKQDSKLSEQVSFQLASIYELPFADNSFDVVHAHQVVIHLEFPEKALKELARVAKHFVFVKDCDLDSTIVYPDSYGQSLGGYFTRSRAGFTRTNAGRALKEVAIRAGYNAKNIIASASVWNVSNDETRLQWGNIAINRIENGGEFNDLPSDKIETLKQGWKDWINDDAGWLTLVHGEIVYKV